ncbi:hypothetical protein D3C76_1443880 [compost metagenome]
MREYIENIKKKGDAFSASIWSYRNELDYGTLYSSGGGDGAFQSGSRIFAHGREG